jgi:AbrB family looped-hinge helix DNA binding protein
MALVKVKEKYQVTLPASVRKKAGLAVGDILEAELQDNKIVMTPKTLVDRELALALRDVRKGRVHGPFRSVKGMLRSLHRGRKSKKTR